MTERGKTAYLTGGASGIGKAVAEMLAGKGINVIIVDRNSQAASAVSSQIQKTHGVESTSYECDVADWNQQMQCFKDAASKRRIDYVYAIAGIGEKQWVKNDAMSREGEYERPDLSVLDVDLTGVLYTISLAIQHFRRQEVNDFGFRGKIVMVASICGFYCVPTLPIYTAAKHGLVGFTRSYGKFIPEEKITLNAVCPNVVQTNISNPDFYEKISSLGLLVPLENVVAVFESLLGSDLRSGETIEVGPRSTTSRSAPEAVDAETQECLDILVGRGRPLHMPKSTK